MEQEQIMSNVKQSAIGYAMKNYAAYNLWANTTLIDWLRTKPASSMEAVVPSSFPSIKETLVHIWQTQQYWTSVVTRTEYTPEPFSGTTEDIFSLLLTQSGQLKDYIAEMNEEDICDHTLVVNPWFECNFNNFEYIIQMVNHGTYHRGQIITIGRNLGFADAPMTDYNYYNVRGK